MTNKIFCMYRWLLIFLLFGFSEKKANDTSWIRINILGYQPEGVKVAVWCSKEQSANDSGLPSGWQLVDTKTNQIVFTGNAGKAFGAYGPFKHTYRLNFSSFKKTRTLLSTGRRNQVTRV